MKFKNKNINEIKLLFTLYLIEKTKSKLTKTIKNNIDDYFNEMISYSNLENYESLKQMYYDYLLYLNYR